MTTSIIEKQREDSFAQIFTWLFTQCFKGEEESKFVDDFAVRLSEERIRFIDETFDADSNLVWTVNANQVDIFSDENGSVAHFDDFDRGYGVLVDIPLYQDLPLLAESMVIKPIDLASRVFGSSDQAHQDFYFIIEGPCDPQGNFTIISFNADSAEGLGFGESTQLYDFKIALLPTQALRDEYVKKLKHKIATPAATEAGNAINKLKEIQDKEVLSTLVSKAPGVMSSLLSSMMAVESKSLLDASFKSIAWTSTGIDNVSVAVNYQATETSVSRKLFFVKEEHGGVILQNDIDEAHVLQQINALIPKIEVILMKEIIMEGNHNGALDYEPKVSLISKPAL